MHRFMTITLTICTLLLGASLAVAAPKAPGDLKLGPPDGIAATKTHVAFPHAKHDAAKVECVTCHHTWDGKSDEIKSMFHFRLSRPTRKEGRQTHSTPLSIPRRRITAVSDATRSVKKNGKPGSGKSCKAPATPSRTYFFALHPQKRKAPLICGAFQV